MQQHLMQMLLHAALSAAPRTARRDLQGFRHWLARLPAPASRAPPTLKRL